ncbi:hypothetical protein DW099_09925 [Emergencia timonensis]|uniref:FeoB-associated Cys-rich membrane protein n=2 Tax=Emergencia timonensis TaxID=1776384 RepID=A0A415E508_9FIRM|nr:hypothetical protein DW099_09925 [Emergencia timonensis]
MFASAGVLVYIIKMEVIEMHYFLTHIGYIIVAAVVIALLAFAAVILAEKNEAKRNVDDERCDFTCSGCPNVSICHKEGKKDV